jgi:hypothetical protein
MVKYVVFTIWYGIVWYKMAWYGMKWYGIECYGMVIIKDKIKGII